MSESKMAPVKLNMLLLGKTGQGKSATGNMLLNRRAFTTSCDSTSATKVVASNFNEFDNYILMVVDGPGLEDTDMNQADDRATSASNMKIALAKCYGGIDAFILVIKFGTRLTAEERATIDSLKNIFGDSFMSHVIVVVSFGDLFLSAMEDSDHPVTFKEWCRQQQGAFGDLYNDCQGRFILLNNREKDEIKKGEQIMQIVHLAHGLQTDTGRYTSKSFDDAAKQRERLILELKAPHLRLEFQEKIGLLTAAIEKYCTNPTEGDKEMIKARIEDLKREIESEDQHYGVLDDLRDLVKRVEENLNDVVTLNTLKNELEETKTARNDWGLLGCLGTVAGVGLTLVATPVVAVAAGVAGGGALLTSIGVLSLNSDAGTIQEKVKEKEKEIALKKKHK